MEIKELYHYMTTASEEQNDKAIEVLSEIMHDLQTRYPSYYKKYDDKLEKIYKHSKMTEAEAKHYVSQMHNKDGSTGEHWTMEQTTDYLMANKEFEHLNPVCFYVALNMMYSDYYKPTRTLETYATLAKDFLEDKDAPADKLKRYIEAMHA